MGMEGGASKGGGVHQEGEGKGEKAIRRDSLTEIGILISIKRDGNIMIYNKNVPEKRCEKEKERRMRILVVEDDSIIAAGLMYSLEQEGYEVVLADCASKARQMMEKMEFGLFLLDLSLPDGNGYEICRMAKAQGDVPVIFLTAVDDEVNVVMGLDMGADDYVTKPFRIRELMSRIKSVLRRYERRDGGSLLERQAEKADKNVVNLDKVSVHLAEAKVFKDGKELMLTAMEYRLLLVFVQNRGQILSRNQLLEGIWDVSGDFVNDNTLTVYMKRLREKLEDDPTDPKLFKTVRGIGYMLRKGEQDE